MNQTTIKTLLIHLSLALSIVLSSCRKDDTIENIDNYFLSFNLTIDETNYAGQINNEQNLILVEGIKPDADLSKAKFTYNISSRAKISTEPSAISDWSKPVEINITAENGDVRKYQINLKRIGESSSNSINSFSIQLESLKFWGEIDQEKNTIHINLPEGTNKKNLTGVECTIPATATIEPNPSVITDYTLPVETKVTAENGDKRVYKIVVNVIPPSLQTGNLFSSFCVKQEGIKYWADIDQDNKVAELILPVKTDLSNLSGLEYTISKNATINPDPKKEKNWLLPKEVKVRSENGKENKYKIIITKVKDTTKIENLLSSFCILHNSLKYWAIIDHEKNTGKLTIPHPVNLKELSHVEFSVSRNASISPDPKTIKDWNKPVELTVKSKKGLSKYTIIIAKSNISQEVFVGDITFTHQKQIDDFGALAYRKIIGKVEIINDDNDSGNDAAKIRNLKALKSLEEISGDFWISDNPELKSLEGLDNLKIVSGGLYVENNWALTDFAALKKLESVGKRLLLRPSADKDIADLTILKSLRTVGGNFDVFHSSKDVKGLAKLEKVGGQFSIYGNNITSLEGLENLKEVNKFKIEYTKINSLSGIKNLTKVTDFELINNDKLLNFKGLVAKNININKLLVKNCGLTSFNGLINCKRINKLEIEDNNKLENLKGLDKVESLSILKIENNSSLKNIDALKAVNWSTSISISDNEKLENINGLASVATIKSIDIYRNKILGNINGLKKIENIENVSIVGNPALANTEGLNTLKTISQNLTIEENSKLTNISSLSGLKAIGESITIKNNAVLNDIDGLKNLTSIGKDLNLINNKISNLDAFLKLKTVKGNISITNNADLNDFCGIKPLATDGQIGGKVSVSKNKYNPSLEDIKTGKCSK
jgi:hypothetical protein